MSEVDFIYPSNGLLCQRLTELFAARDPATPVVTIIKREPMLVSASHPMERVILEVDGHRQDLCCKYARYSDPAHVRHENRHGTAYEASVYVHVLSQIDVTAPRAFGLVDKDDSRWLVTDYLADATTVSGAGTPDALDAAGRWLARFHGQTEGWAECGRASFLHRQTKDFYLACAKRTLEFASGLSRPRPWLENAVRRYRRIAVPLLVSQQTVIHGEFYSSNVLTKNGSILPIDWESAAIGAPEIDLAFLLEGWPEADWVRVLRAYTEVRWPAGAPPAFGARLEAAVMFAQFRWLGDRPEWTAHPQNHWRFTILREWIKKGALK